MKRLITLISAAALLAGCADSGSSQAESSAPDSEAQTTTTATSQTRHISEPYPWEDYEQPVPVTELKSEKYPDKPHLRVMLAKNRGYRLELLDAFNEKLDERGLDFAIDLVMIDEMEKHSMTYCRECFEGGTVPDIIMTGTGVPEEVAASGFPDGYEPHENTYWECVKNGWLEPLDGYLSQGEGAELKEILPVSLTESLTDSAGHIYGFGCWNSTAPVLTFYKETAEKYGFDISAFDGDLASLEPTLEKMKQDGIAGLAAGDWGADMVFEEYLGFSLDACGIFINENTGRAENLFENSEFIALAELMEHYRSAGYAFDAAKADLAVMKPLCSIGQMSLLTEPGTVQVPIGKCYYSNSYKNAVFGISSASQHKEDAFELLRLLYSDKELALLFSCGEEGTDYTVTDETIVINNDAKVPFRGLWVDVSPVNEELLPPVAFRWSKEKPDEIEGESPDKAEILEAASGNSRRSAMYSVTLPDDLLERLKPVAKIYADNYKLFLGTTPDGAEETLERANEKLKEAGIDQLLEEVNGYIKEQTE